MIPYKDEYKAFIDEYNSSPIIAEKVGITIAKMAQYFADANSLYAEKLMLYNKAAENFEKSTDEATGKPISSSKAKVLASATKESDELLSAKADVENIEQMINALKSLQKGILNEYSHIGNS